MKPVTTVHQLDQGGTAEAGVIVKLYPGEVNYIATV